MRVKLGCWIVVFVVGCLTIEEGICNDLKEDIETLVVVLDQTKLCQSDEECHNGGKCEAKEDSAKYCNCKNGTSGDFCEIVDECVSGSVDCGVQNDVSCVYDVQLEKAVCQCDNKSKTFVPDEGRCISPCGYDERGKYIGCTGNGYCIRKAILDLRFCKCDKGATGDFCEIIEECQNKVVDCGTDPSAFCDLRDGHAYCRCSNQELGFGFDYDRKICKDCQCGLQEISCTFQNDTKTCLCPKRTSQKGDVCKVCDCGSGASGCEFKEGKKVCICKDGYIPAGPENLCTKMCNSENPCQNGGTCSQNVCSCLNGTRGDLCDDCSSRCGRADCSYNVTSRDIYCKCYPGYAFDDVNLMCRGCDCGSYSKSCSFVKGQKKCTCSDTIYADRFGQCTLCYCKGYASMYGCKFNSYGRKICNCLRGFAQLDEECKPCDCGKHGNCTLSGWGYGSKTCMCEKRYAVKYGTCEECDCGKNGECEFLSGQKVCYCYEGFSETQGTCKECDCGDFSRCTFDSYGDKECTCIDGHALKLGVCTPCNCDPGTACTFKNQIEKECICPRGYANFLGTCSECDCQMDYSNCTFDKGLRKCQCPTGFVSNKNLLKPLCMDFDECLRPQDNDCPSSTRCVNKWGSYDCECKEGYEVISKYGDIKKDGCKDIDECMDYSACTDIHARCVNTPGSYRCDCEAGYHVEKDSYMEKYNYCSEDARPWRTASIVVGCLFGFVILGLLIGICNKHCE